MFYSLFLLGTLVFGSVFTTQARAQTSGTPQSGTSSDELPPPKLPVKRTFTPAEVQAECRKFEGRFIAYYDRVYKVERCQRREVMKESDEKSDVLAKQRIIVVEGETIAKIPEGEALGTKHEKPSCAKIEGRYILSRGDDLYFIEKCKKRLLPDWDTYADHAQKRGKRGTEIIELSEEALAALAAGNDIKSVLDEEYKKLLDAEKNIDVLPLDEACKGLNGKFVSYYSRIYRIEACRKRPVDAEVFVAKNPRYQLQELTSEQWISIPVGKNLKL
jgi:hypothetical protein